MQEAALYQLIRIAEIEQYRTNNLVTGLPRQIKVSISSQLPTSYINCLDIALARYNAENLQLTFVRVSSGADISILKAREVTWHQQVFLLQRVNHTIKLK